MPNTERIFYLGQAFARGMSIEEVFELTKIDRWFLDNIRQIVLETQKEDFGDPARAAAAAGRSWAFPTASSPSPPGKPEAEVRAARKARGVIPTYRLVDTCAAEFEAYTPYYYSTYGDENERRESGKKHVIILGGGPNRIGQGIEFDYCCVHAAFALKELGFETIMVNSNPETVSTDYDTSDKLYFEPLTLEDVLNICDQETALRRDRAIRRADAAESREGPRGSGRADHRHLAEVHRDRGGPQAFLRHARQAALLQTPGGTATNEAEAVAVAERIGYPVLVRPSFVLGGRAMEIVYNEDDLRRYIRNAVEASPERPILVDRFLEDAAEVDVDCIADGETRGHRRDHGAHRAGRHSLRRQRVRDPRLLADGAGEGGDRPGHQGHGAGAEGARPHERAVRGQGRAGVRAGGESARLPHGAVCEQGHRRAAGQVRGARSWPGETLAELGFTEEIVPPHFAVKEAVFPFIKFPGVDIALGPEMKSTGEVMGIDADLGIAYAKAQMAAQPPLPLTREYLHLRQGLAKAGRGAAGQGFLRPSASRSTRPAARRRPSRKTARR